MVETVGQNGERWSYDVFLSFRGEDVRDNFLSHLYKDLVRSGINTFKDDDELERGENISPALLKAIENSKISLVVLSKNYASSSWCLDELVHIMKCSGSDSQHMVLPVFYKVDPSDVRGQRGSFGESFDKHNNRYPESKLQQWKEALTHIADLAGFHSLGYRSEADLIDNVIRELTRRLPRPYLHLPTYGVGIRSRVDHVKERMCFGSDDVQIIGIHGMGGIGKTTVAKAAYNEFSQHFEGTSFLENFGESIKKPEGKDHFQRQLLSDILRVNGEVKDMDHAVKTKFWNKRVFLVLDDVEDMTQFTSMAIDFSCFGPGSRIIITTRNKHLLEQLGVENIYSPEKLDDGESFELISRHAFRTSTPPEAFRLLSEELVKFSGGLPLAMEILGSLLFNRTTSEWRSTLDQLKQNPDGNIQAKLQISYDALNPGQKKIFLDISCFFIGMDKDYVGCILDDVGLTVLEERCLISFSSDNRIMMHDLLRDMGRHIVRGTSLNNYGGWSRLWEPEHVLDVLTSNYGTDTIEGISLKDGRVTPVNNVKRKSLRNPEHSFQSSILLLALTGNFKIAASSFFMDVYCLKVKAFSNLRKLRLLQLDYVLLEGSYTHFPKELRWLCWRRCPLDSIPTELNLETSVVIELQYSNLKTLWGDQESIMQYLDLKRLWDNAKPPFLKMLKYLDLSYSFKLTNTPDFTYLPNLEKLFMEGCTRLVRVNKSIGTLHKLVLLNLKGCTNLEDLPLEPYALKSLKSLEILVLSYCWNLKRLDDALGTLTSLKDLYLDETGLQDLPTSIGYLKKLRRLYLMGCKSLIKIPDSINELISLKELDISGSSVKEIPLKSGSLPSLTDFSAERCEYLKQIPSSIGGLDSLLRLKLNYTPIETLPMEIGDLRFLLELELIYCESINSLPSSLECLSNLRELSLNHCRELECVPPLPWKLEKLVLENCFALKIISDLSKLKILHELNLINCEKVDDIPGLEHLTALERLYMNGCNSSCSLAVKKRLSKDSLKRMREMSLSENRIPYWFSQGPVTFSAQPNRELRSVILAVVVAYHHLVYVPYGDTKIEAEILKLGEPLFSHSLDFRGLRGTNNDQLYIYRYSSLHPMVTMLEDGFTLQVTTTSGYYVGENLELKMYGFFLGYEVEEDLLFGAQPNDSQKLANIFSTYEEGETSNSYMK